MATKRASFNVETDSGGNFTRDSSHQISGALQSVHMMPGDPPLNNSTEIKVTSLDTGQLVFQSDDFGGSDQIDKRLVVETHDAEDGRKSQPKAHAPVVVHRERLRLEITGGGSNKRAVVNFIFGAGPDRPPAVVEVN